MKVDVILPQGAAFDTAMRRLVALYTLDERYPPFRVASACEMLLFKLQRYQCDERSRSDGMRDDAAWNDIVGMLKVQGPDLDLVLLLGIMRRQGAALDLAYLRQWADALRVRDLLERALVDAGLKGPRRSVALASLTASPLF